MDKDENLSDNDNMIQTQVEEEVNANDSDDKNLYNDYSEGNWIQWFCQMDGNEFFIEIEEEFFKNPNNLLGIPIINKDYK
jgi:hypothetical protein